MYKNGDSIPKDAVNAYMWFSLASAGGDRDAGKLMDDLASKMTAARRRPQHLPACRFALVLASREWPRGPASVFVKFDISVSITPGATALTRIPCGPRMAAQFLTRVSNAPLVEA